jgi:hypothetical protein
VDDVYAYYLKLLTWITAIWALWGLLLHIWNPTAEDGKMLWKLASWVSWAYLGFLIILGWAVILAVG